MIQATPQAVQDEIDRVLSRAAQKGAGTSTKPVLQVNIDAMMKAKNNGFPKGMFHSSLEARFALNEDQEDVLLSQGYRPQYVPRAWPKYLHRRNLHPKFDPEQRPDLNDEQRNSMNPFIESRLVPNEAAASTLRRQKVPKDCTAWFDRVDDIPALDEDLGPTQDESARKIAILEAQLDEARRAQARPENTGVVGPELAQKAASTRFAKQAPGDDSKAGGGA